MPSSLPQIITLIVVLLFALAAVAVIAFATLRARLAALELIQRALDKGEKLDPTLVERLLGRRPEQRGLRMPGIMTIALGAGLALSGVLMADVDAAGLSTRLGNGAILVCLGIGLLVVGRLDRPDRGRPRTGSVPASVAAVAESPKPRRLRRMAEADCRQRVASTSAQARRGGAGRCAVR